MDFSQTFIDLWKSNEWLVVDTTMTNIINIDINLPNRIRFAVSVTSIPTTVRVTSTSDARFMTTLARKEVKLSNDRIRGNVEGFVSWRNLNGSDCFRDCCFKDVHEVRDYLVSPVVKPLDNLINHSSVGPCKVGCILDSRNCMIVDGYLCEDNVPLEEDRSSSIRRNWRIHERMDTDEV